MNIKLYLIVFLSASLMAVSCCKEEKEVVPNEASSGTIMPKGNLVVSIDSVGGLPFTAVSQDFGRLCVAVYDESGARVKQVNQKRGDAYYGMVGMQLEEGEYRVLVVAHGSGGNPTMTHPEKIQFSNSTGYSDTYKCFGMVEVNEDKRVLHYNLERIVAKCGIVVTDTIPEGVARLAFVYKGGSGHFDAATGLGVTQSTQKASCSVLPGMQRSRFDIYTFPHSTSDTLQISIIAMNNADSVLMQRQVVAPVVQNGVTWLIGSLFGGPTDGWVVLDSLLFDQQWDSEMYVDY